MDNLASKLKFPTKFSLGFGVLGQALLTGVVGSYLLFYGTDILGISALVMGNILLLSRIFDGLTDLGMGIIIDKTNHKSGKAKPWIARMAIPFAIFSILLFSAPLSLSTTSKIIWVFVFYNLHALAYTALGISMNTLNVLLTDDEKEQNGLSTIIMFGNIFGNVVINAVAVAALTALSGGNDSFTSGGFIKFSLILGIVSVIGSLATYFFSHEKTTTGKEVATKVSLKQSLASLFGNKYWIMQAINTVFIYLGLMTRLAAMVYYGIYVLGNPDLIVFLVIADNVPSLIAMPIALAISNKIGKKKASLIGLCLSLIGFVIMLTNIYNFPLFIVGLIIKAIFFAPVQGSSNSFIAESAMYSEWKTGIKTEGLAFSAISFANKVGAGVSGILVGYTLNMVGYVAGAPQQTSAAISGIIFLYIGVTLLCTIGQIIIFILYDLDKKMPQVKADLAARKI